VAESRLIIVDGYNLVLRSPTLRPGPERTLRQSREKLVNLLSWAVGAGDARFLVVFDGAEGGGAESGTGRVEVRYSRPPEKADDVIRRVVEDSVSPGRRVTVVTSDLEVARHARAMGADVSLADLFMGSVLASPGGPTESGPSEKPAGLSKRELEDWAALFRDRKPDSEDTEDSEDS